VASLIGKRRPSCPSATAAAGEEDRTEGRAKDINWEDTADSSEDSLESMYRDDLNHDNRSEGERYSNNNTFKLRRRRSPPG
jgi:hypothetical protein